MSCFVIDAESKHAGAGPGAQPAGIRLRPARLRACGSASHAPSLAGGVRPEGVLTRTRRDFRFKVIPIAKGSDNAFDLKSELSS